MAATGTGLFAASSTSAASTAAAATAGTGASAGSGTGTAAAGVISGILWPGEGDRGEEEDGEEQDPILTVAPSETGSHIWVASAPRKKKHRGTLELMRFEHGSDEESSS